MFIGRRNETLKFKALFEEKSSSLSVVYGRRRIGKSYFLRELLKKHDHLFFEGLEHESTLKQIKFFQANLGQQLKDPWIKSLRFENWTDILSWLTDFIKKRRKPLWIVFDEFQWMACQRTGLVGLLKTYWDQHWKHLKIHLILCGSIAHFMVKKVIRSKAFYGRIDLELLMPPLTPKEAHQLLGEKSEYETLLYLMLFGGVPRYLEMLKNKRGYQQALTSLCFEKNANFADEVNKIFFSQFKEAQTYKRIVLALNKENLSLSELAKKLKIKSGGGLREYIENLELAGFVRSYMPNPINKVKNKKFKIFDEFLTFHNRWILPNANLINEEVEQNIFHSVVLPNWSPWLGIAFENFCLKNAMGIANQLGFSNFVKQYAPFRVDSAQFDLVYWRRDKTVTICEIKWSEKPIQADIIAEMKAKLAHFKIKSDTRIELLLIASSGVSKAVKDSRYFDYVVDRHFLLGI